jgi:hypothetical protein
MRQRVEERPSWLCFVSISHWQAQPLNHHRASDLGIKFHCERPSSPSMPISGRPHFFSAPQISTILEFCVHGFNGWQ